MVAADLHIDMRRDCRVRALTVGPEAHFFGYYYVSPWDPSGRWLLAHACAHSERMPLPDEAARIVVIDSETLTTEPIAVTRAWNWQAGSGLQWLPGGGDRYVVFNDLREGRFRGIIYDRYDGSERVLPQAVSGLSHDGRLAVAQDFARLAQIRPVLGYSGGPTVDVADLPDDAGLWLMDLERESSELLLSLRAAVELRSGPDFTTADAAPAYAGRPGYEQPSRGHRLSGGQFSPDDRLILAGHHWPRRQPLELPHFQRHVWDRKLLIDHAAGSVRVLGEDGFYSHQVWLDNEDLLLWGQLQGTIGLWRWSTSQPERCEALLAELVREDPHASLSPCGRWLLGDGYPDAMGRRPLWVCELQSGRRFDIGSFISPAPFDKGPIRCDLHPRWRPDGLAVCIDSVHEGVRQMYEIDVRPVHALSSAPAD